MKISKVHVETATNLVYDGLKRNKVKIKDMEILSSNIDEFLKQVKNGYIEKGIHYPGDIETMKKILEDGVKNTVPHIQHLIALEIKIKNTKES